MIHRMKKWLPKQRVVHFAIFNKFYFLNYLFTKINYKFHFDSMQREHLENGFCIPSRFNLITERSDSNNSTCGMKIL